MHVFQAGKYETVWEACWAQGDWNGDGLFNSDDFVIAFQDGGYEQGPRPDVAVVPEPGVDAIGDRVGFLVVRSADLCHLRTRFTTLVVVP